MRPLHRSAALGLAGLLLLTACGGGGSGGSSTTSAPSTTSSTIDPAVVERYTEVTEAQLAEFAAGTEAARAGRKAGDIPAAQAGGRRIRDAYFTWDAELRKISFPPHAQAEVTALLSALSTAIGAFDRQNVASGEAAYLAADEALGEAVVAVQRAQKDLDLELGASPKASAAGATTSTSRRAAPAKRVTKQGPVSAPYVQGGEVADVGAWGADLGKIGLANAEADFTGSSSFGIVEAWGGAFPFLVGSGRVVGFAVEAPSSGISGFTAFAVNDKQLSSPSNPSVLAYAIKDARGACSLRVAYGHPVPTKDEALRPRSGACTGEEARAVAAASIPALAG